MNISSFVRPLLENAAVLEEHIQVYILVDIYSLLLSTKKQKRNLNL